MHPEIFHIGPFALRSYGFMLAISFFLGLWYIIKRSRREGIEVNFVMNLAFVVIFSGLIGARLAFVLFHLNEFIPNPLSAINPFGTAGQFGIMGMNLYGGVLLAIISGFVYVRRKKQPLWQVFDIFAPAVALGIGITRIGCYLNGCCFGVPTTLPWCVHFPEGSIPYSEFGDACIQPTQLYSSAYGFGLFALLHFVDKRKAFYGSMFSLLLMVEAFFRFVIEFVRYYEPEMYMHTLGITFTYNHLIAVGLFIFGLGLWVSLRRRQELQVRRRIED
jgi:phosphatidylglycerol---prolipoprotein diacylglyceryl transferase